MTGVLFSVLASIDLANFNASCFVFNPGIFCLRVFDNPVVAPLPASSFILSGSFIETYTLSLLANESPATITWFGESIILLTPTSLIGLPIPIDEPVFLNEALE